MKHGYHNMDCMEGMRQFPDKYFSLAVVDPPYFSGPNKRGYYGHKVSPIGVDRVYEKTDDWEVPDKTYFDELMRVSKNKLYGVAITLIIYSDLEELCGINAMIQAVILIAK